MSLSKSNIFYILSTIIPPLIIFVYRIEDYDFYTFSGYDNFLFFEHFYNNSLLNDNFTRLSTNSSPRNVFNYIIIAISELLNIQWKYTLNILHYLSYFSIPLTFFTILKISKKYFGYVNKPLQLYLVILTTLLLYFRSGYLNVLGWVYIPWGMTSHNLSLLICMLGYTLKNKIGKIFIPISILIHPIIGGFFYSTIVSLDFIVKRKINYKLILTILLCYVSIFIIFPSSKFISDKSFIDLYVHLRHPHHYSPLFILSKPFEIIKFLVLNGLLWGVFILKKDKKFLVFPLILLTSSIIQTIFIEFYPLKELAKIGVNRVFYFSIVFVLITLTQIIDFKPPKPKNLKKINVFLLIVASFLSIKFFSKTLENIEKPLESSKHSTELQEKICLSEFKNKRISEILLTKYHYNIYVSTIFPFNSDFFEDYEERYSFSKSINIQNLTENDFHEFDKRDIEYLITKKEVINEKLLYVEKNLDDHFYVYKIIK